MFLSNIDLFANRSPLKTFASRKVIPEYDISAVNLIVWWCLFACSMNCQPHSIDMSVVCRSLVSIDTRGYKDLNSLNKTFSQRSRIFKTG